MPEVIKQKALQLEPVLGSYGACKFSYIFPVEKPFNYNPLKLLSRHMFMTRMPHNFVANAMLTPSDSPQGAIEGTVNLL